MSKPFPSQRYPHLAYTPGEEIWFDASRPDDPFPFYFSLEDEITADEALVERAAYMLDYLDELEKVGREYLEMVIETPGHAQYQLMYDFLQEHLLGLDEESLQEMFRVERPEDLDEIELIDRLRLQRLGCRWDEGLKIQVFSLDFSFNPDYTDQLIVVYLNSEGEVMTISHEN